MSDKSGEAKLWVVNSEECYNTSAEAVRLGIPKEQLLIVIERKYYDALKAELAQANAMIRVLKDAQLRTYDGLAQKADERDQLKAENERLREALEVYANPLSWRTRSGKVGITILTDGNDCEMIDGQFTGGKIAREALKETT
jgi:hypothetical protein